MAIAADDFDSHPEVDEVCEDVHVRENVAIATRLVNEPFWILLCDKSCAHCKRVFH